MFQKRIYIFNAVVENGSFSKAARELMVSQSAVSQQIEKLEEDLGVRLFDRSHYRPVCTPAGEKCYQAFHRMINEYEALKADITKEQEKNLFTIGITGPFENKHVPIILRECRKKYPLQTIIQIHTFQECIDGLENGILDLAFGIANDFINHANLRYHVIRKSHICVVVSREHPLSKLERVNVADIANEPLLVFSRSMGDGFYADFMSAFSRDNMRPNIVRECDNLAEMLVAVRLNEGIAILSTEVVEGETELKTLEIVGSHHSADFVVGYNMHNINKYLFPVLDTVIQYFDNLRDDQ